MVQPIISRILDERQYGSGTEESKGQKSADGHVSERNTTRLAELHEGLVAWEHQIPRG